MDWDWYYRHSEANAVIASQISEKVQANALIEGAGLALSELSQLPEAQVPIPPEVGYRIAAFAAQAAADNRRREAMHSLVAAGPLGAAGTDGAGESNTGGD